MKDAIRTLARELLIIEAKGDYPKAKRFLEEYTHVSHELEKAMQRVADLPIDIVPNHEAVRGNDASKRM